LILEHKNDCEFIAVDHRVLNSEGYQLNIKYLEKFSSKSKLAVRILIIGLNLALLLMFVSTIIFVTIAYCDPEMDFSIVVMLIWWMILILAFYYVISIILIANVYTYLSSLYMKYRFQQVQDLIEIHLERGNILKLDLKR